MNTVNLCLILLGCILFLFLLRQYNWRIRELAYQTTPDNNVHIVADLPNKHKSAAVLSEIKRRLAYLVRYCIKRHPENKDIMLLKKRFRPENVQETSIHDSGTSYTIDKGSELHLCLRDKNNHQLHDINLLMFVAIHELAHIMSTSYGHNDEFAKNFVFLLERAVEANVYIPENYKVNSKKFCGITVNNNPLF